MEWTQIENKWTAMTHRIRADWSTKVAETKVLGRRRTYKVDIAPAPGSQPTISGAVNPAEKMGIE